MQAHFEAYQIVHKAEMPTTTRDSTGSQRGKDFRVGDRWVLHNPYDISTELELGIGTGIGSLCGSSAVPQYLQDSVVNTLY